MPQHLTQPIKLLYYRASGRQGSLHRKSIEVGGLVFLTGGNCQSQYPTHTGVLMVMVTTLCEWQIQQAEFTFKLT